MAEEKWTLDNLTLDQINKAFKRTKEWANLKEGNLVLVTEDLYDKALDFCKNCFLKDEPLSRALGVTLTEEAAEMWKATFNCQMSLMIINQSSGEVMAMRPIRIASEMDQFPVERLSDEKLKTLFGFMQYLDDRANFFQHFRTNSAIHFLGLGVAEQYRRRGLGTKLIEIGLEFVRNLEIDSFYVKVEGSSKYSINIFRKMKFEELFEEKYDNYQTNGKVVIQNVGEHKSVICFGKKITNH